MARASLAAVATAAFSSSSVSSPNVFPSTFGSSSIAALKSVGFETKSICITFYIFSQHDRILGNSFLFLVALLLWPIMAVQLVH